MIDRLTRWFDHRAAHRLARGRRIVAGEWLLDLGMPTPRAVRIHWAWAIQNGHATCCPALPDMMKPER